MKRTKGSSNSWIFNLLAVVLFMAVPMRVNAVPPGYTLEKADEFDNTELDTGLWVPYYLECRTTKERAAARYSFKDGCLVLRIDQDQPTYYSSSDPMKVSSIQTGQRDSLHKDGFNHTIPTIMKYTPQYGYFEIRAKLVNQTGYHCAFWAVGVTDASPQQAEIDIMEQYGNGAASNFNLIPWDDKSLSQSNGTQTLPFNPSTGFHLYALEWDSKSLKFYVDDVLIRTINQAVKYPEVFFLSVYENSGWTGSADLSASKYPREFYVDYFRAYTKGGTADAGAGGSTTGGADGGAGTGGSTSGGRGGATGTSTTSAGGSSGTGGTLSGGSGGAAGSTAGGTGGALGTGGATGTGGVTGGSGGTTAAGGSVGSGGAGASDSSAGQGGHSMTGTSTAPAGRSSGCSCDIARTSHVGLGRLALLVGLLGLAVFRPSRQRGS